MKKILAVLLALALCLGLAPMSALAAEGEFLIEKGVLTKYTGSGGSVVIPDGVTAIGMDAFADCVSMTSVTIPEGVTRIAPGAFRNCSGLTSVNIPASVTQIGGAFPDPFVGCTSLTSFTVSPGGRYQAVDGVLFSSGGQVLRMVPQRKSGSYRIPDGVTGIASQAFWGSYLTSVAIPGSVTQIGDLAFAHSDLTSVSISDSVTSIGKGAFSGCKLLTAASIPSSVTSISDELFEDCPALSSVSIPHSVTRIGSRAFKGCTGLASIDIPGSVTSIGEEAFSGAGLTSLVIPGSVTSMEKGAFSRCGSLASVVISDGITAIGSSMFSHCSNLTAVDIPSSVTSIEGSAFWHCTGLTELTIPGTVASVGYSAFEGCTGLRSAVLSRGVETIGTAAFSECSGLTHVTVPEGVTQINGSTFAGCTSLSSVALPASLASIGYKAFSNSRNLKDVYYAGTQAQWAAVSIDGANAPLKGAAIHFNSAGPDQPDRPAAPFTDVTAAAWYAQPVSWAVERGIAQGTGNNQFSPKQVCSHAAILTFLWRAAGSPASRAELGFTPQMPWAADALRWAKEKGMLSDGFKEEAPCTRADAVRYIWMALGSPEAVYDGRFTDVPADSPCAQAVAWAVENGITVGTSPAAFSPETVCDRGTIVTLLYRAYSDQN